jgi:hypothetical protein
VKFYRILQLVIIILTCSYFLGILWHIITKDLVRWDEELYYDVYQGYNTFYIDPDYGFQPDSCNDYEVNASLIKIWYYGMTTLSTFGWVIYWHFGDLVIRALFLSLMALVTVGKPVKTHLILLAW